MRKAWAIFVTVVTALCAYTVYEQWSLGEPTRLGTAAFALCGIISAIERVWSWAAEPRL